MLDQYKSYTVCCTPRMTKADEAGVAMIHTCDPAPVSWSSRSCSVKCSVRAS